jgi:hypothetical protein
MILQYQPQPIEFVMFLDGIFKKSIDAEINALESPAHEVILAEYHFRKVPGRAL